MEDLRTQSSELATELLGEREPIASGEFGIDAEKAREKLQKFRLPDPHLYVLQFVRAASVLGATRVDFEVDTTRMTCRFDASLSSDRLADIWRVAFGERRSPEEHAVHHLALGLGSAQALNPEQIVVRSGHATLTLGDEEEHFSADDVGDAVDGVEISLKEKFRFGHLVEFFTTRFGDPGEVAALRRYCRFASMTITVGGELLDAGVEWTPQAESMRVALHLSDGAGETHVFVVRDDVLVAEETFEPHGAPGHVVVESRHVRTDISGLSAIRDDVYREVVHGAAMGAYHGAVLQWGKISAQPGPRGARLPLATAFFRFYRQLVDDGLTPSAGTEALREWLETRPLFRSAVRVLMLTPRQIVQDGLLRYSTRPFSDPEIDLGAPVVLRGSEATTNSPSEDDRDRALFAWARCAGAEPTDVTSELVRAERRLRKMRLLMNQEPRARPDSPFQAHVQVDGMEAFAYVPLRTGSLEVHELGRGIRFHLEGRSLMYRPWDLPIGIDLRGSFTPNDAFDGVEVNGSVKRLLAEVVAAVPQVMEGYAHAVIDSAHRSRLRPHPTDQWIDSVLEGNFLWRLLRPCFNNVTLARDVEHVLEGIVGHRAIALLLPPTVFNTRSVFAIPDLMEEDTIRGAPERVVDRLGAVADVETFESFEGEWFSLRALVEIGDELLIANDTAASRRFLRENSDELEGDVGRVILVHGAQRSILRRLAPDARDARVALTAARSEREFMARPRWRDTLQEHEGLGVIGEMDGSSGGNPFIVRLLASPSAFDVVIFLRDDRLLARTAFAESGAGTVLAIVRCESLAPTITFDGVVANDAYQELMEEIRKAGSRLREEWLAKDRPRTRKLVDFEGRQRYGSRKTSALESRGAESCSPPPTTGRSRADAVPPDVTERGETNASPAPDPSDAAEATPRYDDPLLRRLTDLLVEARGHRTDLLDDHFAFSLRWSDEETDESVCEVSGDGVTIFGHHPLVEEVTDRPADDGAIAFLASVVYSQINRYYKTITDPDEVGFQARFLASRIPRAEG